MWPYNDHNSGRTLTPPEDPPQSDHKPVETVAASLPGQRPRDPFHDDVRPEHDLLRQPPDEPIPEVAQHLFALLLQHVPARVVVLDRPVALTDQLQVFPQEVGIEGADGGPDLSLEARCRQATQLYVARRQRLGDRLPRRVHEGEGWAQSGGANGRRRLFQQLDGGTYELGIRVVATTDLVHQRGADQPGCAVEQHQSLGQGKVRGKVHGRTSRRGHEVSLLVALDLAGWQGSGVVDDRGRTRTVARHRKRDRDRQVLPVAEPWGRQAEDQGRRLVAHHGGRVDGLFGASRHDVLARCIGWPGVRAQVHTAPDLYEIARGDAGPQHPGRHSRRVQIGACDGLGGQNPRRGGTHASSLANGEDRGQPTLCITRRRRRQALPKPARAIWRLRVSADRPQVPPEVGHGEGDAAAFAGVDEALLEQRVAGRGQRLGRTAQQPGHLGRRDRAQTVRVRVGHRAEVVALTRGRPLVPAPEEPDGQLGLGLWGADHDVLAGDRRARSGVPDGLAVGLDEVRIAARHLVHLLERSRIPGDALVRGGSHERQVGRIPRQPVDELVAEQPFRVRLRGRQHRRQVRQSRADHDERQPLLAEFVDRRAQTRHVRRPEVLHLVDAQRDAAADIGGQAGDVYEQLHEIDLDVARVGAPCDDGCDDARLPAVRRLSALRRIALDERLQRTEDKPRFGMCQLAYGHVQGGSDRTPHALVGPVSYTHLTLPTKRIV